MRAIARMPTTKKKKSIPTGAKKVMRAASGPGLRRVGISIPIGRLAIELSKTQRGNNNGYCQDNELNWYDWDLDDREQAFLDFTRQAIAFRRRHASFRRRHFLTGQEDGNGVRDVLWWHPDGRRMTDADWGRDDLAAFGMLLRGDRILGVNARGEARSDDTLLLLFNKGWHPVDVVLPSAEAGAPDFWVPAEPFDGPVEAGTFEPGASARAEPQTLSVLTAVFEEE